MNKLFMPDDGSNGAGGVGAGTATAPPPEAPPAAVTEPAGGQAPPPEEPGSLLPGAATAPPPAQAPLGDDWINEDGSFRQGWYQRFPEDIQTHIAKYKSVEELAKGTGEQAKFIGKKGIFLPTEKSTPEEVAEFRKAIGVPDSPDGYHIKPDVVPDGLVWNDDLPKPFLAVAHKHHVSDAAMKDFGKAFMQMEQFRLRATTDMAQAQVMRELQEGAGVLRSTWRDNYDQNIQVVQQACALTGTDPKSKGFRDPAAVMCIARLAGMLSEDKLVAAAGGGGIGSPLTGKAFLLDVVNNPDNIYHKGYKEGHQETVDIVRTRAKQQR